VGSAGDSTLAESWNGTAWTIASSPSPIPAKPNVLSGVTCAASNECWAVGYFFPTHFTGSLTEKWNGTTWSVVHTPTTGSGELIGDSCSATTDCVSAGISNSLFAIGQLWNGTAWVKETPKKPSGAQDSELNGVSCPSGGAACESVGNYLSASSTTLGLAEGWNGSAWALQSTPAISGSTFTSLAGADCTTPANCWAVGQSLDSSSNSTAVIEHWNGTSWSVTAS
jgi:hypothetical protein